MYELEQRKKVLGADIEAAERAQRARPLLHPNMGKLYREWVIEARDGLNDADRRAGATERFAPWLMKSCSRLRAKSSKSF